LDQKPEANSGSQEKQADTRQTIWKRCVPPPQGFVSSNAPVETAHNNSIGFGGECESP